MKNLILLVVVLYNFTAYSRTVEDYQYPIKNKYLSTLSNVIARPVDYKFKATELEIMPERSDIELLEDRHELDITYNLQKKSAPLVFIISGLGGSSQTGSTLILSELVYSMGYHAVTVPNPVSWGFTLGGSRLGITGYAPEDVRDLYRFFKFIDQYLKNKERAKITSYAVMGYSMGALHTGFIQQLDREEKYFNFKRALLINPPIDLLHGISVLDGMYAEGMKMSFERRNWTYGYVIEEGAKIYDRFKRGESISVLASEFKLSDRELQWLIGSSFRYTLRDLILTSQAINDFGILKTPVSKWQRDARAEEAEHYSYYDYLQKFYYPNVDLKGDHDVDSFVRSGSLLVLMEKFKDDPAVYMMHNLDDFLLRPEDPALIQETFGDRCLLFPVGGHVGNLWFDVNQNEIRKVISNL